MRVTASEAEVRSEKAPANSKADVRIGLPLQEWGYKRGKPIVGASACVITCPLTFWLLMLYAISLAAMTPCADNLCLVAKLEEDGKDM